jgi:hypothetical protein
MTGKSAWVIDYERRWPVVLAELSRDGYEAELRTIAAPVSLRGTLPSGEQFYLHCRSQICSLQVSRVDDPVGSWEWRGEVERSTASHLSPEETAQALRELTNRYLIEGHSR